MTTDFVPFELERPLSTWENQIEYNLSESGVHPLTMRQMLDLAGGVAGEIDIRMVHRRPTHSPTIRSDSGMRLCLGKR